MKDGVIYNMSNPIENLSVKILRLQEDIADGWENKLSRPKHEWVLVDQNQDVFNDSKEADRESKAFAHYTGISSSKEDLTDFLRVYGASGKIKANVPESVSYEHVKSEVYKIIKSDLDGYLNIIDGGDFKIKIFLAKALLAKAIIKKSNKYYLPGNDLVNQLFPTYDGTIDELSRWSAPSHDKYDTYLLIEQQIKNTKK